MPKISRQRWGLTWLAGCLFLIDLWGVTTHQAWVTSLDTHVIALVRQPVSTLTTKLMITITTAGNSRCVVWLTLALLAVLVIARRFKAALFLLINVVGWAGIGNTVIKNLVQRPRPTVHRLVTASSYSFPSGHSITAMLLWGTVIILTAYYLANHPVWKALIIGLSSLWIFAIGISRVFVGVHYPTDVLGGWLLGFFVLTLTQWVFTRKGSEL